MTTHIPLEFLDLFWNGFRDGFFWGGYLVWQLFLMAAFMVIARIMII